MTRPEQRSSDNVEWMGYEDMGRNRRELEEDGFLAELGMRVRSARQRRGLTIADLAREAGIGKLALTKIETGKGNPRISTIAHVAGALGVSLATLLPPKARLPKRDR